MLLLAALISFGLAYLDNGSHEEGIRAYIEPFVILLILVLNAIVGVWQEANAEKALEALMEMQSVTAKVVRDRKLVSRGGLSSLQVQTPQSTSQGTRIPVALWPQTSTRGACWVECFDPALLKLVQPYRLGSGHCTQVPSRYVRKKFTLPSCGCCALCALCEAVSRGCQAACGQRRFLFRSCNTVCLQSSELPARDSYGAQGACGELLRAVYMASRQRVAQWSCVAICCRLQAADLLHGHGMQGCAAHGQGLPTRGGPCCLQRHPASAATHTSAPPCRAARWSSTKHRLHAHMCIAGWSSTCLTSIHARHTSVPAVQVSELPSRELVPGDVVILHVGDKVPADVRIMRLKTATLRSEQASLTGESVAVLKRTEPTHEEDCELQARQQCLERNLGGM